MTYPTEFILRCGYYPDTFAEKDLPPDEFFMHRNVTDLAHDAEEDAGLGAARHRYMLVVCEAAEEIIDAIKDKYRLDMGGPFSRTFDVQDCFWSLTLRPEEPPVYIGADAEYPEPC